MLTDQLKTQATARGKALSLTRVVVALFVALFAYAVFRNAWLYDDAYITFRTVDNLVNGYGLTWNADERVQTYTHPLWMFLVAGVYFVTREMFYTSLGLCTLISLAAVLLYAFGLARSGPAALLGVAIFTFSKAFVDYSTSGLENPLTHLLLALFLYLYFQRSYSSQNKFKTLFWLSCCTALGALNRMDTILFYLPTLAYAWFLAARHPDRSTLHPSNLPGFLKGTVVVLVGVIPFILWEVFSLFYYGFPFPNTAYAKLNTSVNALDLARQGLYYLLNSWQADPLTLLVIAAGLLTPLLTRHWSKLPIAAGLGLYLLYVIRIGGDFMTGRFLTAPLFVAVILLTADHRPPTAKQPATPSTTPQPLHPYLLLPTTYSLLLLLVLLIGLTSPYPPLIADVHYGAKFEREELRTEGIQDGRGIYYQYSGLLNALQQPQQLWPNHPWSSKGLEARQAGPSVIVRGAIGFFGFFAGPQVHIVDHWALADPLLARLPADINWQIGHFTRQMPAGYLETLQSGQNQIHNKSLAIYYDKLALVTRGNLFDPNRLGEIWKLNTGQYDHLLAAYRPLFQVALPGAAGSLWSESDNLTDYAGIQINLGQISHADAARIKLAPAAAPAGEARFYRLVYFVGDVAIADQRVEIPAQIPPEGLTPTLPVPTEAAQQGYDNLRIFPSEGENLYSSIYSLKNLELLTLNR